MKAAALTFWSDEHGFLISAELVLILTIGVLGLIVGISTLQSALVYEMNNLAFAFSSLNQSFFVPGFFGCKGTFVGARSFFNNFNNTCLFIGNTGGIGGGGFGGGGFGGGGFGGGGFGGGGFGGGGFGGSDFGVGSGGGYVPQDKEYTPPAVEAAPAATCPPGTTNCPTDATCPQENYPAGTPANGPAIDSNMLKPAPFGPYPGPNVQ